MQKARRHPLYFRRNSQAPTACMHTVSGSLSLAVRRSFHRSLTVLSTIGHRFVFSLGGWSPQIQPGFLVPRPTRVPNKLAYSDFAYGTLTPSGPPFQARSTILSARPFAGSLNPDRTQVPPVWAPPRSLAATWGISLLMSLPRGTEMFQFPRFAPDYSGDGV